MRTRSKLCYTALLLVVVTTPAVFHETDDAYAAPAAIDSIESVSFSEQLGSMLEVNLVASCPINDRHAPPAPEKSQVDLELVGSNAVHFNELGEAVIAGRDTVETLRETVEEAQAAEELTALQAAIDVNATEQMPATDDAIMGKTLTSVEAMTGAFAGSGKTYPAVYELKGAPTIRDWCEICYEESVLEGVRAEIVFAQTMHETGWLQFGGQVDEAQCNFAGLGATNDGRAGVSFDTVRQGIRAQVQHLKAYASTDALVSECVDPRFSLVERGCAPTVVDLNGRWAVPGTTYGQSLMEKVRIIVE